MSFPCEMDANDTSRSAAEWRALHSNARDRVVAVEKRRRRLVVENVVFAALAVTALFAPGRLPGGLLPDTVSRDLDRRIYAGAACVLFTVAAAFFAARHVGGP